MWITPKGCLLVNGTIDNPKLLLNLTVFPESRNKETQFTKCKEKKMKSPKGWICFQRRFHLPSSMWALGLLLRICLCLLPPAPFLSTLPSRASASVLCGLSLYSLNISPFFFFFIFFSLSLIPLKPLLVCSLYISFTSPYTPLVAHLHAAIPVPVSHGILYVTNLNDMHPSD